MISILNDVQDSPKAVGGKVLGGVQDPSQNLTIFSPKNADLSRRRWLNRQENSKRECPRAVKQRSLPAELIIGHWRRADKQQQATSASLWDQSPRVLMGGAPPMESPSNS